MRCLLIKIILCLTIGCLSGCVNITPSTSYAVAMTQQEADIIASSLSVLIADQLPPATSTLAIAPIANNKNNVLTAALYYQLRKAGFSISDPNTQVITGAHSVRYLVTPLSTGLLVRLQIDHLEITSWFNKNSDGIFQADSPFTVRK